MGSAEAPPAALSSSRSSLDWRCLLGILALEYKTFSPLELLSLGWALFSGSGSTRLALKSEPGTQFLAISERWSCDRQLEENFKILIYYIKNKKEE